MPVIYEKISNLAKVGMICDVCLEKNNFGGFVLRYTFGYGSIRDGDQVEAAICDDCLLKILRDRVPHAIYKNS